MGALIALDGRDVVAAFITGGFRIARRERGLALLVRGVQVVVVPETGVLAEARIRSLLERAEVSEDDLMSWLARGGTARATSGFHRRGESDRPPATLDGTSKTSSSSPPPRPDPSNVDARSAVALKTFHEALERWRDAVRELEERDPPALRPRRADRE